MVLTSEIDRNCLKLIKLQTRLSCLNRDLYLKDVQKFLSTDFDINYALPENDQILRYRPDLVGYTALHIAAGLCRDDQDLVLKMILNLGADFICKDKKGFTPLRLAFEKLCVKSIYLAPCVADDGKDPIIDTLLSAHCEFNNVTNPRSSDGISHLHIACVVNNLEIVKFFLEAGEDVNEAINSDSNILPGYTCMHVAMKNRNADMVQLLLSHGANLDCFNADKQKPLHLLNDSHLTDVVFKVTMPAFKSVSLENQRKLDILLKLNTKDFDIFDNLGLTQLHSQCIRTKQNAKDLEDVEKLLKSGADVNAAIKSDSPIWSSYTPMHFAAFHQNEKLTTLLLKNGANFLAVNADGWSPFSVYLKMAAANVSQILAVCEATKAIQLSNGAYLSEVISKFESTDKLRNYLATTDVNAVIPIDSPAWPGRSLLHLAVIFSQEKNASKFKICLEKGADLTIKDTKNMTAFHLSFHLGKRSCLNEIKAAHIDATVNPEDDHGLSHFHIACASANVDVVKKFLDNGVSPDFPLGDDIKMHPTAIVQSEMIKRGSTPLHIAVYIESKQLLQLLLSRGADPHRLDDDGLSWIHRTFTTQKQKLNDHLWTHEKVLQSNPVAPGGLSHFHVACYSANTRVVKTLLPLVADINEPIGGDIKNYIKDLPGAVCVGDTPLHLAIKSLVNTKEVIDLLLKNGADVGAKNEKGENSLHAAIRMQRSLPIVKKLFLESPEFKEKNSPKGSLSRLHVACYLSDLALIKEFLEDGEDIDERINADSSFLPNLSPLDLLPVNINLNEIVNLLLSYVLKNNATSVEDELSDASARPKKPLHNQSKRILQDQEGLSIFHLSCTGSNSENVKKLLEFGANVNAPSDYLSDSKYPGYCPLHFAVEYGNDKTVEILLKHGADVTRENSFGDTPIHQAALYQPRQFNIFLRLCKFDIFVKNSFGETLTDMIFQNLNVYKISADNFLRLLKHSSMKNIDVSNKMRLLKMLVQKFPEYIFKPALQYIPNLNDVDENKRNILHYMVMPPNRLYVPYSVYQNNLEFLIKHGADIDHQDKDGKTPLHYAVILEDLEVVMILLMDGADINVTDVRKKTPYMYCFESKLTLRDQEGRELLPMMDPNKIIMAYLEKIFNQMKATGLNIDPNKEYVKKFMKDFLDFPILNEMKKVHIYRSYSLRAVFTENMVTTFAAMPLHQRNAIIEYMDSTDMQGRYFDWQPLYKMQLRRAQKRQKMFEPALETLQSLLDPRLPRYCVQSILIYLSNKDWENLSGNQKER